MASLGIKEEREEGHGLVMQVCIVGARGSGKSSVVRGALHDIGLLSAMPAEEGDGLSQQRVLYEHRGRRILLDLIEFPADDRYRPLLPQFVCASACVVFVIDVAYGRDQGEFPEQDGGVGPTDPSTLEDWVAVLGGPPKRSLVVANSKTGSPPGAEERARLATLQETASQYSSHVMRVTSPEQLDRSQVLKTICTVVLQEMSDNTDPLHLLGTCVSRETPMSG